MVAQTYQTSRQELKCCFERRLLIHSPDAALAGSGMLYLFAMPLIAAKSVGLYNSKLCTCMRQTTAHAGIAHIQARPCSLNAVL